MRIHFPEKLTCFTLLFPQGQRSAPGLQAVVYLIADEESGVAGDLVFTQIIPNGPVTIEGNITGLAPGLHGVHVHQTGAVKDNCKDIGHHFISYYVSRYSTIIGILT